MSPVITESSQAKRPGNDSEKKEKFPSAQLRLLILTLIRQCSFCLSNAQITDFLVSNEFSAYFSAQKLLNEMIDSELISTTQEKNTTFYRLADAGNEMILCSRLILPGIMQEAVASYIEHLTLTASYQNNNSVFADYVPAKNGEYTVNCVVREKGSNLIELHLNVPDAEQASMMCLQWEEKCEEIYSYLMMQLMS